MPDEPTTSAGPAEGSSSTSSGHVEPSDETTSSLPPSTPPMTDGRPATTSTDSPSVRFRTDVKPSTSWVTGSGAGFGSASASWTTTPSTAPTFSAGAGSAVEAAGGGPAGPTASDTGGSSGDSTSGSTPESDTGFAIGSRAKSDLSAWTPVPADPEWSRPSRSAKRRPAAADTGSTVTGSTVTWDLSAATEAGAPNDVPAEASPGPGTGDDAGERPGRPAKGGRPGRPRARKVRRVLRHIEPWSALKISVLFYAALFVIVCVASVLLWGVARSSGTVDNVESFITSVGGFGNCEPIDGVATTTTTVGDSTDPTAPVDQINPEGTSPTVTEPDTAAVAPGDDSDCRPGEKLVGEFRFEDARIFEAFALGGIVLVLAGSAANVALVLLFNLMSDLTGGVRVTVLEEEPTSKPGRRSGSPAAQRRD